MTSQTNSFSIVLAVIIAVVLIGGGVYFWQTQKITETATVSTPYTDTTSGISFTTPRGWVVSTDEAEQLYTYRENPYLTVTFTTFTDKEKWQKRISKWNGEIAKGKTTQKDSSIGGYPAKLLETGIYGNYYVDGGTKWFEISTADQNSAEISAIIQSIKF